MGKTELGKKYNIFNEDDELVGQQYETDTGPIDILAISKDKKELLVVELKKVEQVMLLLVKSKDIWVILKMKLPKKIKK